MSVAKGPVDHGWLSWGRCPSQHSHPAPSQGIVPARLLTRSSPKWTDGHIKTPNSSTPPTQMSTHVCVHTRARTLLFLKENQRAVAASPSPWESRWLRGSLNHRGVVSPSVSFSLSTRFLLRPQASLPPWEQGRLPSQCWGPLSPAWPLCPAHRPSTPPAVCHKSSWSLDTLQPASEAGYLWVQG